MINAAEVIMNNSFVTGLKKFLFYAVGLILIAVGINFSKLSALGISPVSSVPRSCEVIWGWSLGTMTIIVYCILIVIQIVILGKKFKPINLLGIPIAVAFGVLVDLVGVTVKTQFFGIDTSGVEPQGGEDGNLAPCDAGLLLCEAEQAGQGPAGLDDKPDYEVEPQKAQAGNPAAGGEDKRNACGKRRHYEQERQEGLGAPLDEGPENLPSQFPGGDALF